jgi:hypothetical protein
VSEDAARIREVECLPELLDQADAELLLELADPPPDRRLGEVQVLPGPGVVEVTAHREEGPDLVGSHVEAVLSMHSAHCIVYGVA